MGKGETDVKYVGAIYKCPTCKNPINRWNKRVGSGCQWCNPEEDDDEDDEENDSKDCGGYDDDDKEEDIVNDDIGYVEDD